ncbi:MAG TPA: hypothetical protein VFI31_14965, partial [Pirellulales bacterium]|nr:hypothetical protein [Pirellulales bacterium]
SEVQHEGAKRLSVINSSKLFDRHRTNSSNGCEIRRTYFIREGRYHSTLHVPCAAIQTRPTVRGRRTFPLSLRHRLGGLQFGHEENRKYKKEPRMAPMGTDDVFGFAVHCDSAR